MKAMITGAGGFLGKNLIDTILKQTGHDIIALTTQPEKFEKISQYESPRLSIVPTNKYASIDYQKIDILINCAYPRNEDGIKIAEGLYFISDLLKVAHEMGVRAVINISSQSVYSQTRTDPATESTAPNLESKYAVGKYATELLTNTICCDIPHTNVRMASLIGAEFDQRMTNKLIDQALSGKVLKIVNGNQLLSFLDVRDAAQAIIAMIESDPRNWNEIYNLGSDDSYTTLEILQIISEIIQDETNMEVNYYVENTDDMSNNSLKSILFENTFSWKPAYKLNNTLKWIIQEKTPRQFP